MKYLLSLCMSVLITLPASYSYAEDHDAINKGIDNIAEAINKAGRQRMLGQRIVKNFLMIGSEIQSADAQRELDRAIALFEQQHIELKDFAPTAEIQQALDHVTLLWTDYRLKALSPPQLIIGQELIKDSDQLFKASNKVVSLLEAYSGTSKAQLVNISGKQRMLSQKIAKLYMGMYWRVSVSDIEPDFTSTIDQFEQGLLTLMSAPENTLLINQKLRKVKAQWDFSKAGFSQYKNGRFVPTIISITSESMLIKMDEITFLYQELSK